MKRSIRRHHRRRMIAHTLRNIPWIDTLDHAVRMHKHRKACSCMICGNQRKHHGPTFKEIAQKEFLTHDPDYANIRYR